MMTNKTSYYILALSFLVFSCESTDLTSVERKLSSISNSQGAILDKLDKVEKSQSALQKGMAELKKGQAPAANKSNNKKQQPPKSDPNKVYDIAIGNSIVLGKKDASVTIIEWTDFQ